MKRVIRANDGRLKIIYQSSRNRVQIRDQGYTYRKQSRSVGPSRPWILVRDYLLNMDDTKEKNLYESYRIKSTSDAHLGKRPSSTVFRCDI